MTNNVSFVNAVYRLRKDSFIIVLLQVAGTAAQSADFAGR